MKKQIPVSLWVHIALILLSQTISSRGEALRLANGEPLTCIYYFGHWWEPWSSNDDAIRADFKNFKTWGLNTVLLDHEWSQAIDGNWKLIDREHRLAKEIGIKIIPWLTIKTGLELDKSRVPIFKSWFGQDLIVEFGKQQDGTDAAPIIPQESIISGYSQYAIMYLARYKDGAHLRFFERESDDGFWWFSYWRWWGA